MDDEVLREKALQMAVKAAQAEGYHPGKIIDIANQFYEFLNGGECKRYEGLSEGWFKRMNPSGSDIDIACEILNKAGIRLAKLDKVTSIEVLRAQKINIDVTDDTIIIS